MKRHAALAVAALAVGAVAGAAVALRRHVPRDPYVAHLMERIDALLPAVERELGASIPGRIRVVVSTREELGELNHREMRDVLRAIEGAPTGGDDVGEGRWTTWGELGCVDEDATIHVCRQELEGAPHDDLAGAVYDSVAGTGKAQGPEMVDRVLVHELVHVFQNRAMRARAYLRASRHRGDLLARCAVLEGQAEAVTFRVTGLPAFDAAESAKYEARFAKVVESYGMFELESDVQRAVFPYVQGRAFVESAIARLGRDAAVRRVFDEAPSLMQVEHPESWPDAPAPSAGTDAMLRRAREWLDTEWEETDCRPLPSAIFLRLLGPASRDVQTSAADSLLEVQRIEAKGAVYRHAARGHLLAAHDEAGARTLFDAWVEAARARDAFVPADPSFRGKRVLESAWTNAEVDGQPALLATRRYRIMNDRLLEHSGVVRRGRYVLELRLVEDPGGTQAVLRLARRLLACAVDAPEHGDLDATVWDARWRFASDARSDVDRLRPLLVDSDADVRHAALWSLLRRDALTTDERVRARRDADPLVRLTALTGGGKKTAPTADDVLAAIRDADPWVAGGGWCAAQGNYGGSIALVEVIANALRRPEAAVRRAASRLIGEEGGTDDERLALIRTALADDDAGVRDHGAKPLLHIARETAGLGDVFSALLTGADDVLRTGALIDLSIRNGVPGTAAALMPFLRQDENVEYAIEALGKLGAEASPAIPAIRRIADESERADKTSLRLDALVALGAITGDRAEIVGVVRGLLTTGADKDARLAAGVVKELGPAAADVVPDMAKRLESANRSLVLTLLSVLDDLGAVAAPALPAIERLCESDDPVVSKRAGWAREEIRKCAAAASRK